MVIKRDGEEYHHRLTQTPSESEEMIHKAGIRLRLMKEEDMYCVLEVYKCNEDFLSLGPRPKASVEMVEDDVEYSKGEGGCYCTLIDEKEDIVGIVDFIPKYYKNNPLYAYISLIMISRQHRYKGYGKKVTSLLEKCFKDEYGVELVFVSVQVNNRAGISFWASLGYEIYSGPELRPDTTIVYHMKKQLV